MTDPTGEYRYLTEDQAQDVAQRAVEGVLQRLGIDTRDPLQAQADFQKLRVLRKLLDDEEFVADLAFMRRWRTGTERVTDVGIRTFVKWLVVGLLGLVALVSKDWWLRHITG